MDSEVKFKVEVIVAETETELEKKYEQWLNNNLSAVIISHSISASPLQGDNPKNKLIITLAIIYCNNQDFLNKIIKENNLSIPRAFLIVEKEFIKRALIITKGNRMKAASILEISHRALLYKLRDYGLEEKGYPFIKPRKLPRKTKKA